MIRVASLRLEITRSNTCSMYRGGTSSSVLITRLNSPA